MRCSKALRCSASQGSCHSGAPRRKTSKVSGDPLLRHGGAAHENASAGGSDTFRQHAAQMLSVGAGAWPTAVPRAVGPKVARYTSLPSVGAGELPAAVPRAAGLAKRPFPAPLASFLDPGQPSPRGLHCGGLVAVFLARAILEDPTLAGTPQARPAQDLGAAALHRHEGLAEALALDLRQEGGRLVYEGAPMHTIHTHTHTQGHPRNTDTHARSPKTCSSTQARTCATACTFWGPGLLATVVFLPVPLAASSFALGGSFFPAFVPFSVRVPLTVSFVTLGFVG